MNRFAALLDRLVYAPQRTVKLRAIERYLRDTPDPDRGYALAALTGSLSFKHAKARLIRTLAEARVDPVLFRLSYDYVGDLAETVALIWPQRHGANRAPELSEIVAGLEAASKAELPGLVEGWLDALDADGRWALIKLMTEGPLRVGVSGRLAKTAAAAIGGVEPDEIELVWPGLHPPYTELFAWLEGRSERPRGIARAPFRPVMLAHALEERDLAVLKPGDFAAEWKWDGIQVQAVSDRGEARLYTRTGEDVSPPFPMLFVWGETRLSMASCWCSATANRRASMTCSSAWIASRSQRRCFRTIRPVSAPTTSCIWTGRTCGRCRTAHGGRG